MLHYILTDLQDTVTHIPVSIAAGVLALALCVFINRYFRKNLPCGSGFLLGVYLEQLAWLVFFNRPPGSRRSLDLSLFDTLSHSIRGNSYVLENILLFIPFGLLLPMFFRGRCGFLLCTVLAFLCSLFIETIQYITARGYSQTDDIAMNVLGAIIGYVLFQVTKLVYRAARQLL